MRHRDSESYGDEGPVWGPQPLLHRGGWRNPPQLPPGLPPYTARPLREYAGPLPSTGEPLVFERGTAKPEE